MENVNNKPALSTGDGLLRFLRTMMSGQNSMPAGKDV